MTPTAWEKSLREDVSHIAGTIGERNLERYKALLDTEHYITELFRNAGLAVKRQVMQVNGREVANIEVEWKGQRQSDGIIVIDTPEKVDYPRLGQVTQALFKAIERLAFET